MPKSKFILLTILVQTLFVFSLHAQEMILGDADVLYPTEKASKPIGSGTWELRTPPPPPTGLTLPVFDDFSYNSYMPDQSIWVIDSQRTPAIELRKGLKVPTKGVAVFDGVGYDQVKQRTVLAQGLADSLTSRTIDFTDMSPADNIYLSFFLQPGGNGDVPESIDSFFVWFGYLDTTITIDTLVDPILVPNDTIITVIDTLIDTVYMDTTFVTDTSYTFDTTGFDSTFVPDTTFLQTRNRVFAVAGDSLPTNDFSSVIIPVNDSAYFRNSFSFKFGSFGSLNGVLDLWHLDYVYISKGRTASDTLFNDASVSVPDTSILGLYSHIPRRHYNAALMSSFNVPLSNLSSSIANRTVNVALQSPEPFTGVTLGGTISGSNASSIPANGHLSQGFAAFSDQNPLSDGVLLRMTTWINDIAADTNNTNDTLVTEYRIDTLMAYDDGVAEVAYGLTSGRGFCQRFTLPDPAYDTLTGVWIRFVPSLYYNAAAGSSTCLDNKAFTFAIWSDFGGQPDTLVFTRLGGMRVSYGDEPNEFVRFDVKDLLGGPITVPETFYIGMIQQDNMTIGIGMDMDTDHSADIFYQNSSFIWTNTSASGTLMIRPEFGGDPNVVSRQKEQKPIKQVLSVYPNPNFGDDLNLKLSMVNKAPINVSLMDIQGKTISSHVFGGGQDLYQVPVPASISPGMYFLRVMGEDWEKPMFERVILNQ